MSGKKSQQRRHPLTWRASFLLFFVRFLFFFPFFFPFSSPIAVEFAMDQDGNLEKVGLVGPNIVGSSQGNCLY